MKTPLPRRLFFWTLVVSYICMTTLVLLYVFGYHRDFAAKIFVYTGSISIKTNPSNTTILIDGHSPRSRLINIINNTYHIRNLRARKYTVTVTADGYKPWYKEAIVHSGVATEFWNVILVRDAYERTYYNLDHVDTFFPAPKEHLFAATRQVNNLHTVRIFNVDTDTTTHTFLFSDMRFTSDPRANIEWSPDSRAIAIPLEKTADGTSDYAVAFMENNTTHLLSQILPHPTIRAVRWDPKEKNSLYYIADTTLYRTALNTAQQPAITAPTTVATDVLAYDFTDDGIYILTTTHTLLHDRDVRGTNTKELTTFDLPPTARDVRLDAYDNTRIIVLNDTDHELFLYNRGAYNIYKKKLSHNIVGAHFSDDGKKLLYYSPFEIFIYYTRDWDAQPQPKEDTVQPIIRYSQVLDNINFSKDYAHVLYTVGTDLKITELDNRAGTTTETILTTHTAQTKMINRHKQNLLYIIDRDDDMPRRLQSIVFPEKQFLQF